MKKIFFFFLSLGLIASASALLYRSVTVGYESRYVRVEYVTEITQVGNSNVFQARDCVYVLDKKNKKVAYTSC